jgi:hypothetical protein
MEIIFEENKEAIIESIKEDFLFNNYIWYKTLKEGVKGLNFGFLKKDKSYMPFGYKKKLFFYSLYFSPFTTPYIFKEKIDFSFLFKKIKNIIFMEIVDEGNKISDEKGFLKIKNFYCNIDLKRDIYLIEKNYKKSLREQIRQAKRKGVIFREMEERDLNDFYKIYEKLMKIKYKRKPLYPFNFFKSIFKNLFPERARGFVAEVNSKIASGVICLHPFKNFSLAFIQGTDPDYYNYRVSSFIFDEIIKYYKNKNFETFSFGLTPLKSSGTLFFKESFGCEKKEVYIYRYINPIYKLFKGFEKIH